MTADVYAADAKLLAPSGEPIEGGAIPDFWAGATESGIRGSSLQTST